MQPTQYVVSQFNQLFLSKFLSNLNLNQIKSFFWLLTSTLNSNWLTKIVLENIVKFIIDFDFLKFLNEIKSELCNPLVNLTGFSQTFH